MNFEEKEVAKVVNLSPALSPESARVVREIASALFALLGNSPLPHAAPEMALAAVPVESRRVVDVVNDFLLAKARAGRSDRYLRQLRVSLCSFVAGRALRPLASITAGEIEKWMDDKDWSARTQRGYLADVRTLFNFASRRGLVSHNPAAGVELPVLDDFAAPAIHTPGQVTQVLETARKRNLDVCRILAVRYFAGLRSAEAQRVTEENIRDNVIEVTAKQSKTRRRRLVTIQPNLRAWLNLGGTLRPMSDYRTVRPVLRASKVPWFHNVTRHSFVSYHVAHFQNAAKTALEAGHTEQMLFSNYRELVTPASAKEFWSIVPQ